MTEISLLRPHIWQTTPDITAAVTTANMGQISGGKIPGMNMSISLEDDPERVYAYRKRVLEQLGLPNAGIATGGQVHSNTIAVVDSPGHHPETDGLITTASDIFLGILVADCAAILLADRKNKIIAALHAGWRGAVSHILPKALERMNQLGSEYQHIEAYISPCISLEKFEVGDEVAEQFPETFVDRANYRKPHVDLQGYLRQQLRDFGVSDQAITVDDRCTMSDSELYSFRRQKYESGRMMALICQR